MECVFAEAEARRRQLASQFAAHVTDGFLQFIRAPDDLYPDLNFTDRRRTFNDPAHRVTWRTKQVMDFAFLFSYCQPLSEFYMVLEDDIITSHYYLTAIRDFIHMHRGHDWVGLKFTQFMIIGNLVRSATLPRLVQLMLLFREEQPVDFIMSHFLSMMVDAPGPPTRRVPSLFNHIGRRSSLANKTQKLVDRSFRPVPRRFHQRNPPADVVTNMKPHAGHLAAYAYSAAPGLFWGALLADRAECSDWTLLDEFGPSGAVDAQALERLMPFGVQCLRVEVSPNHTGLVAITEIALIEEPP
ncbi:alpha-1,3-mannosyl-glycoprotein 4-beta-N-acetylglucosaminyltransferase C-like [Pollicipes pollicipes]|uniref:alpha-1,3-mannosyl-glycoprotein 4-beta-N-acetylglucosaminyltransferase C-like n=1 Tax=Pollicipes pollicipes TaxID=41117 RepID=UPI001884DE48|nr:alpha-1,3-mannosyl-glycoprotein 4-beta-N-acetylglucosaminyltransferase C-like [Pollicipes pollicipes]